MANMIPAVKYLFLSDLEPEKSLMPKNISTIPISTITPTANQLLLELETPSSLKVEVVELVIVEENTGKIINNVPNIISIMPTILYLSISLNKVYQISYKISISYRKLKVKMIL